MAVEVFRFILFFPSLNWEYKDQNLSECHITIFIV